MKTKYRLLAGAILSASLSFSPSARSEEGHERLGAEKTSVEFVHIKIKNLQNQTLGRIKDLGIDLVNGRIVELLVVSDSSLDVGNKIVAVPPSALTADADPKVYRLNVSQEVFRSAAAIDLPKWEESGRSERVAAAYRLFGREPYFLEEGDTANAASARPKVPLGYVERCNKLLEMPVRNLQGHRFGDVWTMTLDILSGRILNVIILADGNFKTKSIVPAMALTFNPARDGLLLDDTREEFADEPRYVYKEAAFGNEASHKEESYKGPRTSVALEQGNEYWDLDRTARIHRDMRAARLNGRNVEVGTINGRVTLRGWVYTADDKRRIGEVAITASRLELVDNQITVGRPVATN